VTARLENLCSTTFRSRHRCFTRCPDPAPRVSSGRRVAENYLRNTATNPRRASGLRALNRSEMKLADAAQGLDGSKQGRSPHSRRARSSRAASKRAVSPGVPHRRIFSPSTNSASSSCTERRGVFPLEYPERFNVDPPPRRSLSVASLVPSPLGVAPPSLVHMLSCHNERPRKHIRTVAEARRSVDTPSI